MKISGKVFILEKCSAERIDYYSPLDRRTSVMDLSSTWAPRTAPASNKSKFHLGGGPMVERWLIIYTMHVAYFGVTHIRNFT